MSVATANPIRSDKAVLLLIVGTALGNLPLLAIHLRNMWAQPQYQYFPIVLGVIAYLIWRSAEWKPHPSPSALTFPLGIICLVASLLTGLKGTELLSPWVGAAAAAMAFGGVLLVFRNRLYIENPVGIWFLSLLVLRPPMGWDSRLAFWLQGITAKVAGALLDICHVVNLVEGNTIVLRDRHLFVEEACSGIVSLMSIIACCGILAVWQNRPAPHAILLTISGAIWAGILNVFRITTLAIALDKMGVDLTEGWRHEALGLVLFSGTLLLSFCTDRLLLFLMTPITSADSQVYGDYAPADDQNLLSKIFNLAVEPARLFYRPAPVDADGRPISPKVTRSIIPKWVPILAVLFVGLGIAQVVRAGMGAKKFKRAEADVAFLQLAEQSMPEQLHTLSRMRFEAIERNVNDINGQHTRQWAYSNSQFAGLFSVDFVFRDFHELTACYEGLGWTLATRRVVTRPDTDQVFVEATFTKETGERSFLVFGSFDQQGNNIPPPDAGLQSSLQARLFKAGEGVPGGVYQTQVIVQSIADLTESQRAEATKTYFAFYDRATQVAKGDQ